MENKVIPKHLEQFLLLFSHYSKPLTEANLDKIFSLEIVHSEFDFHGLRIDMLAFDREASALHSFIYFIGKQLRLRIL
jgi:hypothetical protein